MQVVVELLDIVVPLLVQPHLDAHTERAAGAARPQELLPLVQDGVLVDELLEAPVVGAAEAVDRVLDVHVLARAVHDREHHLDLDGLVGQVLEEDAEEVLAVGAGAVRVEDEAPVGGLFAGAAVVVVGAVGAGKMVRLRLRLRLNYSKA